MPKTTLAFMLGLMLGIKTSFKGIMHLVYLSIIALLWFKPAHFVWHVGYLSLTGQGHLPNDDGYRTGAIALLAGFFAVINLIWAICIGVRQDH
jgi:hypothetical protein